MTGDMIAAFVGPALGVKRGRNLNDVLAAHTGDADLLAASTESHDETIVQMHWLLTRIKLAAPQALTV